MKALKIIGILIGLGVVLYIVYILIVGKKSTEKSQYELKKDGSNLTSIDDGITINPAFLNQGGLSSTDL